MSNNTSVVERHGCIVCGKVYNVVVVYTPGGQLLDCTVTSGDGHRVPDARRPLVACDTHTAAEIEAAYARLYSNHAQAKDKEQEDD
jgi:hypothetical protein